MIKVLLFLEISHYIVTQFFLAMGIGHSFIGSGERWHNYICNRLYEL